MEKKARFAMAHLVSDLSGVLREQTLGQNDLGLLKLDNETNARLDALIGHQVQSMDKPIAETETAFDPTHINDFDNYASLLEFSEEEFKKMEEIKTQGTTNTSRGRFSLIEINAIRGEWDRR